jgi:16S rRNA (cytosine1402-N4)-methyltransferase
MHKSVLKKEVLEYLKPHQNENFIDATTGEAGHTLEILKENKPKGKVLGIEFDQKVYSELKKKNIERLVLVNDSYINLEKIIQKNKFQPVSGILFDLGFLSWHIDESKRGFSFKDSEKLDMRYNTNQELTAKKIINEWDEKEIYKIIKEYGEEKFAHKISKNIIKKRREIEIKTTDRLVEIIKKSVPSWYRHKRIHPATKTFQSLRIAVNDELNSIKKVLPQAIKILEKGGRIVVISFHSLEDKIIKKFFKKQSKKNVLKVLTKKPITPTKKEIINNPRSRSAKLRAAIKI